LGLNDEAYRTLEEVYAEAVQGGFPEDVVSSLTMRAEIERGRSNYEASLQLLIEAEQHAEAAGYVKGLCNVHINRGSILFFQQRNEEAQERWRQAYECGMAHGYKVIATNALFNMGAVITRVHGPHAAIEFYGTMGRDERHADDVLLQAELDINMGLNYNIMGEYQKARSKLMGAMVQLGSIGDRPRMAQCLQFLSSSIWNLGERDSAITMIQQAISIYGEVGDLERARECESKLFQFRQEQGPPQEALSQYMRYVTLKDSLEEHKRGRSMQALEIQYETGKKEQALRMSVMELEQERGLKQRRELQRNILIGIMAALIAISVLIYRSAMQKRKLAEQQRLIGEQRLQHVLKEQELKLMNAMLEGQERERKRVAQDLHDGLGSMLSATKLRLVSLVPKDDAAGSTELEGHDKAVAMLDAAVQEVRRISHDMMAGGLERSGLAHALQDLCAAVRVPGLMVDLVVHGLEKRVPGQVELAVYRMVQELLGNAMKHSEATRIEVQVVRQDNTLNVIVDDDGVGFDPTSAEGGLGLGGLVRRAEALGGTVHIDSRPGRGTSVSIDLPLGG
jgi:signal transduction histidine kinase